MMLRQIKAKEGVRLEQKLEIVCRIEAGERQVGVSSVLCLSGPTSKYLQIALINLRSCSSCFCCNCCKVNCYKKYTYREDLLKIRPSDTRPFKSSSLKAKAEYVSLFVYWGKESYQDFIVWIDSLWRLRSSSYISGLSNTRPTEPYDVARCWLDV